MASLAASVSDTLLSQFLGFAQLCVDKGDAPRDGSYDKALQGLQVAAAQAGPRVAERVWAWRDGSQRQAKMERSDLYKQKKMLVTDALAIEALVSLARAGPGPLPGELLPRLEAVAFDWALEQASYVDARFNELVGLKERVLGVASELLGVVSVTRLGSVTERFVREVDARIKADSSSPQRQQLLWMLQGMRGIQLRGDTPEQLMAATNFLERAHPHRTVAQDKKSRLQQAICEMLTPVLERVLEQGNPSSFGSGCDAALRKKWVLSVTGMRQDLLKWVTKQSKQVPSGLPTVAVLTLLEEEKALLASIDELMGLIHKQLKIRSNASMALLCLIVVVGAFLRRMAGKIGRDKLAGWTDNAVAPAVQGMMKGGLGAQEQQELLRELCATVAAHLPDLALTRMVLPLLSPDGANWDAPMAGSMALLTILAGVPGRVAAAGGPQGGLLPGAEGLALTAMERAPLGSVWLPPPEPTRDLLDLIKLGYNPLEAYAVPHLLPKVSQALSRLITACHPLYGYARQTNPSSRVVSDAVARERSAVLPVFVMALQCVPFIMPDHWAEGRAFEDAQQYSLQGYTVHIEGAMRQVSSTVLRRMMSALPHLRDRLVGSLATFVVRTQEEYTEVIKEGLGLLMSLMRDWATLAAAETAAGLVAASPASSSAAGGVGSSLHRVEGAALALLCSLDAEVRRLAIELLQCARELYSAFSGGTAWGSRRSSVDPLMLGAPAAYGAAGTAGAASQQAQQQQRRSSTAASGGTTAGGGGLGPGRRPSQQSAAGDSVPSTPGAGGGGFAEVGRLVFVADVIDRYGGAVSQRSYWDIGRWSDLWREWRPVPPGVTFQHCMARTREPEDNIRWARLLCELMREVWRLCEVSAAAAFGEMKAKLQGLVTVDSGGRSVLPLDGRLDLGRSYCLAMLAAPLVEGGERAGAIRDLVRMLVSSARSGTEAQQSVAVLALGNVSLSAQALVAVEAGVMMDDYADQRVPRSMSMSAVPGMGRSSKGARKDDVRLAHAHTLRLLADNLPPGALLRPHWVPESRREMPVLRERLVEWLRDALRHLASPAAGEPSREGLELRHCLAVVARACALQGGLERQTRKELFALFSQWCEEGRPQGQFRSDLRRSLASLKLRVKDQEAGAKVEAELTEMSEILEHSAYLGMAAMLSGPLFAEEVRNPEGQAFSWVDRMLYAASQQAQRGGEPSLTGRSPAAAWGPPKGGVARSGLRHLLQSNPGLAPVYVDKSYVRDPAISGGYFEVLSQVLAGSEEEGPLPAPAHVLLSLVLHRVVDPHREVRDAARDLLRVLSVREWRRDSLYSTDMEPQPPDLGDALVVGALHDSQAAHQLRLSARLAREQAALAEPLVGEVLARQLDNDSGPDVLLCLCPWLSHISLGPRWEGQPAERLLSLLYRTTAAKEKRQAYQVQRLWATLGGSRRNVVPILDFLMDRGFRECATGVDQGETPCAVGKVVSLYLSRVQPATTIDYLVQELAQQMSAADGGAGRGEPSQASTPRVLEFQHRREEGEAPWPGIAAQPPVAPSVSNSRPATPLAAVASGGRLSGVVPLVKSHSAWSESSFTSAAEGAGRGSGAGGPADGGANSPPSSRRSSDIRNSFAWDRRGALTRPELALCLLSELAYEQDEEFRRHLPVLLHIVTLNADSLSATVRLECAQLLAYLLQSLSWKHLEAAAAAGPHSPEFQRVGRLIERLQGLRGRPLWAREQPTLEQPYVASAVDVAAFVQTVVESFYFDSALRERWCGEALRWAAGAQARHSASRSHTVFCALGPPLASGPCNLLLAALHKCLSITTAQSLDTGVEVLCTLHALLANLGPGKAVLYPQLVLGALCLLCSSVVRIGELALRMLLQVLPQLDLGDPTVQLTLLALLPLREGEEAEGGLSGDENAPTHNVPGAGRGGREAHLWPLGQGLLGGVPDAGESLGPWVALPQLVVKGLFQPQTQLLALEVLAVVGRQIGQAPLPRHKQQQQQQWGGGSRGVGGGLFYPDAGLFSSLTLAEELLGEDGVAGSASGGIASVVGSPEVCVAISLGAALPWLWVHLSDGDTAGTAAAFLEGMSSACGALGWQDLSAVLAALAGMAGLDAEPVVLLGPLTQALCGALFPSHARLVVQRLLEVVRRGAEQYQAAALAVLQLLFEVPGVDLGDVSWFAGRQSQVMAALSPLVDSPLGPRVLALFQAMMHWQGAEGEGEPDSAKAEPGSARGPGGQEEDWEPLDWAQCMDDLGESNRLCVEALARVLEACPGGEQQLVGRGASEGAGLLPFLS